MFHADEKHLPASALARLPCNVYLLGKCDGRIVVGELAIGRRVRRPERDAVVDVEDTGGAAGGPDDRGGLEVVLLSVHLTVNKGTAANGVHAGGGLVNDQYSEGSIRAAPYGLRSILGEVVAGDEVASDTLIQTSPAVVGGRDDGVLETTRVLEVQVQLAVLGLLARGDAGADVGLELIETVGDNLIILVKNQLGDKAFLASLLPLSRQDAAQASNRIFLPSCLERC